MQKTEHYCLIVTQNLFVKDTAGKKVKYSPDNIEHLRDRVRVIVVNAIFNNISVISWGSVSFLEETKVPGENNRPAAGH